MSSSSLYRPWKCLFLCILVIFWMVGFSQNLSYKVKASAEILMENKDSWFVCIQIHHFMLFTPSCISFQIVNDILVYMLKIFLYCIEMKISYPDQYIKLGNEFDVWFLSISVNKMYSISKEKGWKTLHWCASHWGCVTLRHTYLHHYSLTHTRPRDMARSRPPFWSFSFAAWKWVNMDGNWRNFDGNISSYV